MTNELPKTIDNIKLGGRKWRLTFVTAKELPSDCWGDCRVDAPKDEIRVRDSHTLSDQHFLDTLIHELLHGIWFTGLSEEIVESSATEIARVLLRSGRISVKRPNE